MNNWYVIYTAPRAEKQVRDRLVETGVEVFLPLHMTPRQWSDRVKLVEMPLFPSYLFVYTTRAVLYDLVKINGVARVVYFQGEPAVVRQKEIDALSRFLEYAYGRACVIAPDDEVRIAAGPLKDQDARVLTVTKTKVRLRLNTLGMMVDVGLDQVVKK